MWAVPAQAETTSLAALMGLGQSVECSYQKTDEDGTQSGTIYLAGGKMRGDLQITSSDGTYPMKMINDGSYQYLWGGPLGETQGMKMANTAGRSGRSPHGQHGPDMEEPMDYQCKPWAVDASLLQVPQDVQFMEMGQMMPAGMAEAMSGSGAPHGGMDMKAVHCAACDQAPAEEQAECRQMFGC